MDNLLEYQEEEWESVGSALIAEFLEEWRFFAPSNNLTRDILQLNDEFGSDYFEREYENLATDESGVVISEQLTKDDNWLSQVSGILFHRREETAERSVQSEEEAVYFFQAFISERVFNHLAMLSRSRRAKKGKPFSIRKELTKGVAEKLGLGLYVHKKTSPELREKAEEVLLRLAREFQSWLIEEKGGMFTTIWGVMYDSSRGIAAEGISHYSLLLISDVEMGAALTTQQ